MIIIKIINRNIWLTNLKKFKYHSFKNTHFSEGKCLANVSKPDKLEILNNRSHMLCLKIINNKNIVLKENKIFYSGTQLSASDNDGMCVCFCIIWKKVEYIWNFFLRTYWKNKNKIIFDFFIKIFDFPWYLSTQNFLKFVSVYSIIFLN